MLVTGFHIVANLFTQTRLLAILEKKFFIYLFMYQYNRDTKLDRGDQRLY